MSPVDRYVYSSEGFYVDTTKPWHDPWSEEDPEETLFEEIDAGETLNDQDFRIAKLEAELATADERYVAMLMNMTDYKAQMEQAETDLQAAQWALAQWHAEEDDWVRDRATLESELAALNDDLNVSKRLNAKWMDERTEAIMRAEGAEEALAAQRLPHSPARAPRRGQVGQ